VIVIRVRRTAAAATRVAAGLVAGALRDDPRLVLGLPTGRTVVGFYAALVQLHRRGRADFRRATGFNLDEFYGLGPDAKQSFRAFLQRHFYDHVNLPSSRAHALSGNPASWRREAARFDRRMRAAGGLGLCVLGIGRNGHVAFNEPARRLRGPTHLERLTPMTRRDNAAAFGGRWQDVPARALTVGLDAILGARQVLLVATGRSKAGIIHRAFCGPVTGRVPASMLQRHASVTVVLDRAAAARLGR